MSRAAIALFAFLAGLVYADYTRPPEREYVLASSGATAPKSNLRPCGGLWVRHEGARFRGPVHCAPSADMTKRRPLPNHILTLPIEVTP